MSNVTPIAPQFATSATTTLVFKETKFGSLSGDSGTVKDAEGNVMFKIDAKLLTLSDRRDVMDASGTNIGQIRKKKTPGLHKMWYLGTMDDEKKCAVKAKGTLDITKCDADIYIGDTVVGECSGNWRAKSFTISIEGNQVADVHRKTDAGGLLLDADSYSIEISAGVDSAFITMIVIALDEIYHDKK
mmetsp:Transcript_5705/g.12429  ORF Transcript_5705/g.12429 Transcript_5705/m.12429 type:complete len:187 (+) Transcript_5705:87-647(+)